MKGLFYSLRPEILVKEIDVSSSFLSISPTSISGRREYLCVCNADYKMKAPVMLVQSTGMEWFFTRVSWSCRILPLNLSIKYSFYLCVMLVSSMGKVLFWRVFNFFVPRLCKEFCYKSLYLPYWSRLRSPCRSDLSHHVWDEILFFPSKSCLPLFFIFGSFLLYFCFLLLRRCRGNGE
jgi:hypothetical protein